MVLDKVQIDHKLMKSSIENNKGFQELLGRVYVAALNVYTHYMFNLLLGLNAINILNFFPNKVDFECVLRIEPLAPLAHINIVFPQQFAMNINSTFRLINIWFLSSNTLLDIFLVTISIWLLISNVICFFITTHMYFITWKFHQYIAISLPATGETICCISTPVCMFCNFMCWKAPVVCWTVDLYSMRTDTSLTFPFLSLYLQRYLVCLGQLFAAHYQI